MTEPTQPNTLDNEQFMKVLAVHLNDLDPIMDAAPQRQPDGKFELTAELPEETATMYWSPSSQGNWVATVSPVDPLDNDEEIEKTIVANVSASEMDPAIVARSIVSAVETRLKDHLSIPGGYERPVVADHLREVVRLLRTKAPLLSHGIGFCPSPETFYICVSLPLSRSHPFDDRSLLFGCEDDFWGEFVGDDDDVYRDYDSEPKFETTVSSDCYDADIIADAILETTVRVWHDRQVDVVLI